MIWLIKCSQVVWNFKTKTCEAWACCFQNKLVSLYVSRYGKQQAKDSTNYGDHATGEFKSIGKAWYMNLNLTWFDSKWGIQNNKPIQSEVYVMDSTNHSYHA